MKSQSKKIELSSQMNDESEIIIDKGMIQESPKMILDESMKIRIKSNGNPKRNNKNSFENFQLYIDNPEISISEFKELFLKSEGNISKKLKNPISWIKWDLSKGFIELYKKFD
jgi:hypothetical protein